MKALHILKIVLRDTIMSSEKEYIKEAIKELEDLQNRSCENCKNCRQFAELGLCDVLRGYTNMHLIKYCGRWEQK